MDLIRKNVKQERVIVLIGLVLSILAIFSSLMGILNENIYGELVSSGVISNTLLVGSTAQDIITLPISISLLIISIIYYRKGKLKFLIAILGIFWYLFYAYGLYVIQGDYTSIYMVYLVIFSLSIYGMIWGLVYYSKNQKSKLIISKSIIRIIIIFLSFILIVLVPVWILRMLPDINLNIPGETYGVFILDLCVVFPAFAQIIYLLIKKVQAAYVLAGIALFKVFTLCLSWMFAEIFTAYKLQIDLQIEMVLISGTLTILSILILIPYLKKLNVVKENLE